MSAQFSDRVPEGRRWRGRRHVRPRAQGGPARSLAQEDRRRHRQGHAGLEGPQGHRQAHHPEQAGQGRGRPLRRSPHHQGTSKDDLIDLRRRHRNVLGISLDSIAIAES